MNYEKFLRPISKSELRELNSPETRPHVHQFDYLSTSGSIHPTGILDLHAPTVEDSILMILSAYRRSNRVISRTLMMKVVFLFYEEFLIAQGIDSSAERDAGYFSYKYGPYSIRTNIALASLAIAGKIKVKNWNDSDEAINEQRKKTNEKGQQSRYIALFETNLRFNDAVQRYLPTLEAFDIDVNVFHRKLSVWKRIWDQKTAKGIMNYIYHNPRYRKFLEDSELKNKFPEIFAGRVKEDFWTRTVQK